MAGFNRKCGQLAAGWFQAVLQAATPRSPLPPAPRRPAGVPCFPTSDPYYQVMYNGLDSMMQRFLDEARLLSRDELGEANVTSPRLDLLFKVG